VKTRLSGASRMSTPASFRLILTRKAADEIAHFIMLHERTFPDVGSIADGAILKDI
jgi:hypothetical protein